MPAYRLIYHFRRGDNPITEDTNLEDEESWDGKEVFWFETDEPLGPTLEEIRGLQSHILKERNHSAVTFDILQPGVYPSV